MACDADALKPDLHTLAARYRRGGGRRSFLG